MKPRITLALLIALPLVALPMAAAGSVDLAPLNTVKTKAAALVKESAQELSDNGWTMDADAWRTATAGTPILVWAYSESLGALRPAYWLVPALKGKKPVGLLALAPLDAHFSWRATRLNKAQISLVIALNAQTGSQLTEFARKQVDGALHSGLDFDRVVAASISGFYYWLVPSRAENLHMSVCLPVGTDGEHFALWQALARGRSANASWQLPADAGFPPHMKPMGAEGAATAGELWMVGEVPLYQQRGVASGWAAALSMVRQWWSPVTLGKQAEQAERIGKYVGATEKSGAGIQQLFKVMSNWRDVDARFANFRTVWFGSGLPIAESEDGLSWTGDDLRTWLVREAPVIVAIDSDGMGPNDEVDQYAVVVGFSAKHSHLYVNSPWGLVDTFSAQDFDQRYWSAFFGVSCDLPALCAAPKYARRGLVGGLPGDLEGPPTPGPSASFPTVVSDSGVATVSNVGIMLHAPDVTAYGGKDNFGQSYQTTCVLELPAAKPGKAPVQKGDWTELKITKTESGVKATASQAGAIPAEGLISGGSFEVTFPGGPAEIEATIKCTAFDADDRSHFQSQDRTKVYDDSVEPDGDKHMRMPSLVHAEVTHRSKVVVKDDDPSPPSITVLSPEVLYDGHKGAYRLKARITDASGLDKTGVKWSFTEDEPKSFGSFDGREGSLYWVDIPRGEWIEQIGKNINFWLMAKDDDDDRDDDASTGVERFAVRIEDDDTAGPTLVQYVVERAENKQFRVLARLEDASGVFVSQSWPKLYYSFSDNLGPEDFDGLAKMVPAPKHGPGWFTAVAPWGEAGAQEAAAAEKKKKDTFIYFKVRAYDLDDDREKDDLNSWSMMWSEVYLPAPYADTRTIVDIWPAGEVDSDVISWNDWFDPPPNNVPSVLFFEGRPNEVDPPPVPDTVIGGNSKIRIHIAVSLAFVNSGATLAITGASLTSNDFNLRAEIINKKGSFDLGTLKFKTEDEMEGDVVVPLPPGALSTGENILVLAPAKGTTTEDQLSLQRILIEALEPPKPPKTEE